MADLGPATGADPSSEPAPEKAESRGFPVAGVRGLAHPRSYLALLGVMAAMMVASMWAALVLLPSHVLGGIGVPPLGESTPGIVLGIALWTAIALVSSAFPISMPNGNRHDVSSAPTVAAMALGGPVAGALVAAIGTLDSRELRGKVPWYAFAANRIVCSVGAVVGGFLMLLLSGVIPGQAGMAVAAIAGGAAFVACNQLAAIAVVLTSDADASVHAMAHDVSSQFLADFSLAIVGYLMAQEATVALWNVAFFVVPLVALYTVYKRLLTVHEQDRLRMEKQAAESANRAKSAFLAMMSHEIRTPMNAIMGNAQLLGDSVLAPDERESVETIETAGSALLSLINDVLDFSKIEADRMELDRTGFAPVALVESVVKLFGINARGKGIGLAAQIDPAMPAILAGDPLRLRQVLSNLVGNAIKFTASGGVTVKASVVAIADDETRLRFEVTDTGIGIDDEGRKRLFAPFVQVDAATTRKFGGTGLGLAISKRLVGLMGGQIGVDSTVGAGSTFWFTVALAKATPAEISAVQTANQPVEKNTDIIGAHVLVAEDNLPNKRLIERLLARLGVDAEIVGNGVDAVAAARGKAFDLILMDCHMPELDGFDATREIRAGGSSIPIIALTADAMSGDREVCIEAGMDDYLAKPIVTAELIRTLRRWLPDRTAVATTGEPEPRAIRLARSGKELDTARIAELCALDPDGSAGFLAHMIADYETTLNETVPAIRAAVESGDALGLEEAAHKLKGTAAQLGARRVNDAAVRLLVLCRSGSLAGAELILADLQGAQSPTVTALRGLLTQTADEDHKAA